MALPVFLLLLLVAIRGCSGATWCICRSDVGDSALQKTIDYACGSGADCSAILQSGSCYQPNTVLAHCSYAANNYFQKKGEAAGSCDFSGTATMTNTDPSSGTCSYPSNASLLGMPTSTSSPPNTLTPSNSTGLGFGLSPTGSIFSPDASGGTPLPEEWKGTLLVLVLLSALLHNIV